MQSQDDHDGDKTGDANYSFVDLVTGSTSDHSQDYSFLEINTQGTFHITRATFNIIILNLSTTKGSENYDYPEFSETSQSNASQPGGQYNFTMTEGAESLIQPSASLSQDGYSDRGDLSMPTGTPSTCFCTY